MSVGCAVMWAYLSGADLIRTRNEYYDAHPEEKPDDYPE